jgi:hypothetical protein
MSDDNEVGYGKPPKKTQFKKGQSGCPTGRPKNVKNLKTIVHEEAYSKVEIKEAGKKRKVTKVVALFKRMMAKGKAGSGLGRSKTVTWSRSAHSRKASAWTRAISAGHYRSGSWPRISSRRSLPVVSLSI